MSDWQPIETAPRDGTVVDLWHKDGFRFTDEWWVEDEGESFWTCLFDDSHFTHWKKITEPVTDADEESIEDAAMRLGNANKENNKDQL